MGREVNWYSAWGKRGFDVLAVIALAPVAAPVLAVLCLAIVVVDRRNPLFLQRRLGKDQRPFTLYKLRTLPSSTGDTPTHETDLGGASRLGRLLRKSKLDELPQILNVVSGEMSLVGPRPGLVNQEQLIRERQARNVFSVRPGITGRSQMLGLDMSDPARLADSDAVYAEHIALLSDLVILANTFGVRR